LELNKVIFSKQIRENKSKSQLDLVAILEESILVQSTHSGEILFKPNISSQLVIGLPNFGVMSLNSQSCKLDITLLILQMAAGHLKDVVFFT